MLKMHERQVMPKSVRDGIRRIVKLLPDPWANDGEVITIVGQGFVGDVVAKMGRWRTRDKKFRVKVVPESQAEEC